MSDGWVWNGPRFPSNYPPGHPNFRHHRPIGTKPPGPNTFNPNKKQPKLYPQSSTNQGFQKKNRKYDNRYVGSRGAGQAEPVRKGEIATETLDTSSNIFLQVSVLKSLSFRCLMRTSIFFVALQCIK